MQLVAVEGARPKRVAPRREREIYCLLRVNPELFEKDTQFKLLYVNKRAEKGPDFVAVNRKGHLLLGEVKKGGLPTSAWSQAKRYAKRFANMREAELNIQLARSGISKKVRDLLRGFLSSTGFAALLNPSRRKLHLVFVAEAFSDRILRATTRDSLGRVLRSKVKDVKCVELRTYRVPRAATLAIASVVGGRRRRFRR
ncbi:MAG: hypothetical protein HY725_04210 [Candidatus Rokubacteria bacterium]|nr:hypothetical protein [Candidatus Rokubacteria bacterium]